MITISATVVSLPYFFRLKIKLTLFLSLKNTCMTLFTCKTIDLYVLVSSSRGVKAILPKQNISIDATCVVKVA